MNKKEPAKKTTITNLIHNSEQKIKELYKELKVGLTVSSLMDNKTPELYVYTQNLQNGINFILMDIGTSFKAEISVSNTYEKRFHIKNILSSISEGYKLLYNFGKLRNKSLWSKLMNKLKEYNDEELIEDGNKIENSLKEYGKTEIDQSLRNLTLHYDKEMISVYKKTISINSEEEAMQKVCAFWDILQKIILFTNKVDKYCLMQTGKEKPFPSSPIKLNINIFHQIVVNIINKDGNLEEFINNVPTSTVQSIDIMANCWDSTKKIEDFIHTKTPVNSDIPEIINVQVLTNNQLLMRLMMLDLASIVDSYIKSSSNIECALNLRRICVIKVSTLVHLYGYNENEQKKSIWKQIEGIIPNNSIELKKQFKKIGVILENLVSNTNDKELRSTFVHLFDNSKACTDISNVIHKIEEINPITIISEITLLFNINSVLIKFSSILMEDLAEDAHIKALQSNEILNKKMDTFLNIIEDTNLPESQKKQIIDYINKIKTLTDF